MNNAKRIENAIEWIRRLGTTKMKQDTGQLGNRKQGFCCLGFGCYINKIDYRHEMGTNMDFQNIVGLRNVSGVPNKIDLELLTYLNDDLEFTFKEISIHLKKYPDAYFTPAVARGIQKNLRSK